MISIALIQEVVAKEYGVTVKDLCSDSRYSEYTRPRHVAMYLSRAMTPHSFSTIGRQFGNKDHTSVIYAFQQAPKVSGELIPRLRDLVLARAGP